MMRTTLLIGLCCALAAPATAASRPATAEFGEFCRTTTSLVPCTNDHAPRLANSLTGYNPRAADEFSPLAGRNARIQPATVQLAENSETPKDLATALKEYIDGLLGKKPAPKPAPTAAEPAAPAAPVAPATIVEPTKAEIGKALADLLAERESWGTAPNGAAPVDTAAPAAIAQPAKADIDKALAALLGERESWGTAPAAAAGSERSSGSASSAPSGNPSSVTAEATGDLGKFIALRESWGTSQPKPVEAPLAKGASKRLDLGGSRKQATGPAAPVIVNAADLPPIPVLGLISQADIVRARNALLEMRAGWGTKPALPAASVTGDLAAYIERRERWGKGPQAKPVKAPLAKGATSGRNASASSAQPENSDVTVNPAKARPVLTVAEVSGDSISANLKQLFATRESWGTEPTLSTRVFAGDLNAYFARRDGWGTGPEPKLVKAPLAKGALAKLRLAKAAAIEAGGPEVIVNALEDRPLPQVADLASDQISGAIKALLVEREGWGTKPALSGQSFAGDLQRYFARRDAWGTGAKPVAVNAPLAKGAPGRLRLNAAAAPAGDGKPPIINELEARPLPQVADISADQIGNAMKELLAERESWGTEPSSSEALVAGDLTAFIARRERWGTGPEPATVKAPLAKGAKPRLQLAANPKPAGDAAPVIVNELEARPLPQVGDIAPESIKTALQDLLATRSGWGTEPAISGARFAGDLERYLARRDAWGKGPNPRAVKATLAKGAPGRLRLAKASAPSGDSKPAIVNEAEARPLPQVADIPSDQIGGAMKALLSEREAWGTAPSMAALPAAITGTQTAAVTPNSTIGDAERTRCSGDLNALASKRAILFANGSAELTSSSNAVLDDITATIKRCGDISVRIDGHTDAAGAAGKNQALSESRAKSVLDYLVGAGISPAKLNAVGHGETKPVASNASRQTRALNRRIEFAIE